MPSTHAHAAQSRRAPPARRPRCHGLSLPVPRRCSGSRRSCAAGRTRCLASPPALGDLSLNLAGGRAPQQQAAIEKAGSMLREAREAAGITTQELGRAIDISDPDLLDQAEVGKVALPFEVILRLAGVLGRHDPVTFVMKLARSYNPQLWKALDDLGIGRLAVQVDASANSPTFTAQRCRAPAVRRGIQCGARFRQDRLRHGGDFSQRDGRRASLAARIPAGTGERRAQALAQAARLSATGPHAALVASSANVKIHLCGQNQNNMKSLSGLDGAFLSLETPATPMHVGSLHLFQTPPRYRGIFATPSRR